MTADGFLSRWSRRKLDPRQVDEPGPSPPSTDLEAEAASNAALSPHGEGSSGKLSAEDIAALPPIEEFTSQTDLLPFLRAGVPALLRKAALRRMWSLDPAIRDFVGEARDYSYDWNVAGGVPVSGPLLPGDDVEATLGRMFSRPYAPEQEGADSAAGEPPCADLEPTGLAQPESDENAADAAPLDGHGQDDGAALLWAPAVAQQADDGPSVTAAPGSPTRPSRAIRPRRHGAAAPKLD